VAELAKMTDRALDIDARSRKNVWSAIFRRKGGRGLYTKLFDELTAQEQQVVISLAGLDLRSELPVFTSVSYGETWAVFTTRRLVFGEGNSPKQIALCDIVNVELDKGDLKSLGISAKQLISSLLVTTKDGKQSKVHFEGGSSLGAILNILNNVIARNRRSRV
jgi:hypothetical protein